jgi:hypothetical protein
MPHDGDRSVRQRPEVSRVRLLDRKHDVGPVECLGLVPPSGGKEFVGLPVGAVEPVSVGEDIVRIEEPPHAGHGLEQTGIEDVREHDDVEPALPEQGADIGCGFGIEVAVDRQVQVKRLADYPDGLPPGAPQHAAGRQAPKDVEPVFPVALHRRSVGPKILLQVQVVHLVSQVGEPLAHVPHPRARAGIARVRRHRGDQEDPAGTRLVASCTQTGPSGD